MRLIDADALKELFSEVIGHIAQKPEMNGNLEHMIRASAMVIQMIDDAPTVRPEVIRCPDCYYNDGTAYCELHFRNVKAKDFCSWAERREDG